METIKVIAGWLLEEKEIGTLSFEKVRQAEMYSFEYSNDWLKDPKSFSIDRDLPLVKGRMFAQNGIFKCFTDAMPDRWGRNLIEIRDYQVSKRRSRLTSWDYLINIEDSLRSGGFRFKSQGGIYISNSDVRQIPPIVGLNELMQAACEIEKCARTHSTPDNRWVERLFRPGSSVGGARPKACVKDGEDLYIAKFPSISDDIDKGKWEHFAHRMAAECGIDVAETRIVESNKGDSILLSKRFDRDGTRRIHMASSMSLLGYDDGTDGSSGKGYCDIVEFIVGNCADPEKNLEELYRRVAFSICIGNCDDHFRNHSFLLTEKGWTLSPAYDLNPSLDRHHAILINSETDESDLDILIDSCDEYMLDAKTAKGIVSDVAREMKYWEKIARDCGLSRSEMKYFRDRFEEGMSCSVLSGLKR